MLLFLSFYSSCAYPTVQHSLMARVHCNPQDEAKGRRANDTIGIGGKASNFFTGTGIVQQQEASATL